MKAIEITESFKSIWDSFVSQSPFNSILQSWEWGTFNQEYGEETFRLGVIDSRLSDGDNFFQAESQMLGAMLLVKRDLGKKGSYFYSPHGPVLADEKKSATLKLLLKKAEQLAKKENVSFLRLEPKEDLTDLLKTEPENETVQAQYTLMMDIKPEAEKLLKNMKSKHRYNIRLAKRKGVEVKKAETVQAIDDFWELMEQNTEVNSFTTHPKDYFSKQFEILSEAGMQDLIFAYKGDKIIAAVLVGYFGSTGYYLHGALDRKHQKLMAPHLLQWEAILSSKEKGCTKYNFWGVAPPKADDNHPWQGFTRFKEGFCPDTKLTQYPGTYYLPYNQLVYSGFKTLKKVRKWLDF